MLLPFMSVRCDLHPFDRIYLDTKCTKKKRNLQSVECVYGQLRGTPKSNYVINNVNDRKERQICNTSSVHEVEYEYYQSLCLSLLISPCL